MRMTVYDFDKMLAWKKCRRKSGGCWWFCVFLYLLNIGWGARSTIYEEDWEDETYKI